MTNQLIFGSMGVAGLVGILCILDMAAGVPFGRYSMMLDIMFLLSAGIIVYIGWDTFRELS